MCYENNNTNMRPERRAGTEDVYSDDMKKKKKNEKKKRKNKYIYKNSRFNPFGT